MGLFHVFLVALVACAMGNETAVDVPGPSEPVPETLPAASPPFPAQAQVGSVVDSPVDVKVVDESHLNSPSHQLYVAQSRTKAEAKAMNVPVTTSYAIPTVPEEEMYPQTHDNYNSYSVAMDPMETEHETRHQAYNPSAHAPSVEADKSWTVPVDSSSTRIVPKVTPLAPSTEAPAVREEPMPIDRMEPSDRSEDIYQMPLGSQTTTAAATSVSQKFLNVLAISAPLLAVLLV